MKRVKNPPLKSDVQTQKLAAPPRPVATANCYNQSKPGPFRSVERARSLNRRLRTQTLLEEQFTHRVAIKMPSGTRGSAFCGEPDPHRPSTTT